MLAPLQSTLSRLRFKEQLYELRARVPLALLVLDETLEPVYVHEQGRSLLSWLNRSSRFGKRHRELYDTHRSGTDGPSRLLSFENGTIQVRRTARQGVAHLVVYDSGKDGAPSLANLTRR